MKYFNVEETKKLHGSITKTDNFGCSAADISEFIYANCIGINDDFEQDIDAIDINTHFEYKDFGKEYDRTPAKDLILNNKDRYNGYNWIIKIDSQEEYYYLKNLLAEIKEGIYQNQVECLTEQVVDLKEEIKTLKKQNKSKSIEFKESSNKDFSPFSSKEENKKTEMNMKM